MMFLRYETFRSYIRLYPITTVFLVMNLIVFVLDTYVLNHELTYRGVFIQDPILSPYGMTEPWRYLTSITLHGGWEHLLFNCFSILVFAPPLEKWLGHLRYLLFYLAAGVAGNALSALVHANDTHVSLGASGAIYGVFGAFLFLAIFRKSELDEATRKTIYSVLIFGMIYSFIAPNINIWAHIGGGICGFALMSLTASRRSRNQQSS
jgi:rhomboid protease GluP